MSYDFRQFICYRIASIVNNNRCLVNKMVEPLELTQTQWQILSAFNYLDNPCSQQELQKAKNIEKAQLTRTIEQLVQRGLLARAACKEDRRRFNIAITQNGKKMLKKIEKIFVKDNALMTAGLTEKEKGVLDKLLSKVANNITTEIEKKK